MDDRTQAQPPGTPPQVGDTPPADRTQAPTPAEAARAVELSGPAAPDGYAWLGELGRGGMGVVYKAREVALDRVVALKMILAGGYASDHELARFEAEAAAVAAVRHPHVVQVHHAGRHAGLPYFVMEFVPGGTLADRLADGPLPPAAAARVVEQVARGMAAAHAAGVLHRDLKPANVLLTADGTPKVTDFGLAKRVDHPDGPTASGAVVGTPSYMSPEQARGDSKSVGPAADVYGLGATLYCALTGKPPFQAPSTFETLRQVEAADPLPVRQLQPGVPRDLETITLTCLAKEPARRYASAAALADDLGRFRAGEPIRARPAGSVERAVKWVRRNRTPTAAAGLAFAALAAGAGVSLWQAGVARAEAANARASAAQARDEEGKAKAAEAVAVVRQREERKARETAEAVKAFMQQVFTLGTAQGRAGIDPAAAVARPDVTVRAARDYAVTALGDRFAERPRIDADVRQTIGKVYLLLGAYPEAEAQLKAARAARHADGAGTLEADSDLAVVYGSQGKLADAERLHRQVLAGRREALGDRHPDTLAALANLGTTVYSAGRNEEAVGLLREALTARREALGDRHPSTLTSVANLGSVLRTVGRLDEAEGLLREALAARRAALGDRHPDTLDTLDSLGGVHAARRQFADAERLYAEALAGCRAVHGDAHPTTLKCLANLAGSYWARGRPADADPLYREAVAGSRKVLGDRHPETLRAIDNLGSVATARQRYADAESLHAEALAGRRAVLGDRHPDTLKTLNNLAGLSYQRGRYADAARYHREALAGRRAVLGGRHPDTLKTLYNLGSMYAALGRNVDAEPLLAEAAAGYDAVLGDRHPEAVMAAVNLGKVYYDTGRYAAAAPLFRRAVAAYERADGGKAALLPRVRGYLGVCMAETGDPAAEPLLAAAYRDLAARRPYPPAAVAQLHAIVRSAARIDDARGRPAAAAAWRARLADLPREPAPRPRAG